jgi:hypothetical protein
MDNLKLWFLTTRHNRFSEEEKAATAVRNYTRNRLGHIETYFVILVV